MFYALWTGQKCFVKNGFKKSQSFRHFSFKKIIVFVLLGNRTFLQFFTLLGKNHTFWAKSALFRTFGQKSHF